MLKKSNRVSKRRLINHVTSISTKEFSTTIGVGEGLLDTDGLRLGVSADGEDEITLLVDIEVDDVFWSPVELSTPIVEFAGITLGLLETLGLIDGKELGFGESDGLIDGNNDGRDDIDGKLDGLTDADNDG